MLHRLAGVFGPASFMPHGFCYLWDPSLYLTHAISDLLIGLAYVAISATLVHLVRSASRDIPFHWMFLAFGLFIIACGGTHFMEVITVWAPLYWLAADVKIVTAAASVATAFALPPLVPKVRELIVAARLSQERKASLETANAELEDLYGRLKELDEVKTQFFANVSHELRTPLALILGPTEKLLAGGLEPEQRRNLEVIDRNARTLLKHVNDLLDVSKLEAGKMELHYQEADLALLVRLTTAHFDTHARDRHVAFAVDTPDSLPSQVDPEKIERVLLNLISNAFKFTPAQGAIRCTLAAEGRQTVLSVRDSGVGVKPELRQAIFERFRQGGLPR